MPHMLKRKDYERQLDSLHLELIELQRWVALRGRRLCVLFEGRDAAGKGGTIKAITEKLETRHYRIVALPRPGETERGQWYFQRYVPHLPQAGEIVLFDRSWYNRAVVEPALGFCTQAQYRRFLDDCPVFEELLVRDGIILLKYWLAVDQAEQEQRFRARADDPAKRWKLSPVDLASRRKYAKTGVRLHFSKLHSDSCSPDSCSPPDATMETAVHRAEATFRSLRWCQRFAGA